MPPQLAASLHCGRDVGTFDAAINSASARALARAVSYAAQRMPSRAPGDQTVWSVSGMGGL